MCGPILTIEKCQSIHIDVRQAIDYNKLIKLDEYDDVESMRQTLKTLWNIIDEIDTVGDIAKTNNKLYRGLVENLQKQRWNTNITSDGYELFIKQ